MLPISLIRYPHVLDVPTSTSWITPLMKKNMLAKTFHSST